MKSVGRYKWKFKQISVSSKVYSYSICHRKGSLENKKGNLFRIAFLLVPGTSQNLIPILRNAWPGLLSLSFNRSMNP
jgi:hypothetical protein